MSLIAPTVRRLIERLRPELELVIDLFSADLEPLLEPAATPIGRRLFDAMTTSEVIAQRLEHLFQTGEPELVEVPGLRIALAATSGRRESRILVAVAGTELLLDTDADARLRQRLERACQAVKLAVEGEFAVAMRLHEEQRRARRLEGVIRFLPYLTSCPSEKDALLAMVHAAALWYDRDARVYRRDLGDVYQLEAWPPGAALDDAPREFPASLLRDDTSACVRLSSCIELEQFGWREGTSEVTLVPIGAASQRTHVIALAGELTAETEAVFVAIAHMFGQCLQHYDADRAHIVDRWISTVMLEGDEPAGTALDAMLADLRRSISADAGRIVVDGATLASFGPHAIDVEPDGPSERATPHFISVPLRVAEGGGALQFRTSSAAGFAPSALALVRGAARAVEIWLAGARTARRNRRPIVDTRPESAV